MAPPRSFAEFWPIYLRAHRHPGCRRLHFLGTTGSIVGLAFAIGLGNPVWFLAGGVFAYAMAWVGHFGLERNRPATFGNPIWSLIGDFRMYGLWLTGRLDRALLAAGCSDTSRH